MRVFVCACFYVSVSKRWCVCVIVSLGLCLCLSVSMFSGIRVFMYVCLCRNLCLWMLLQFFSVDICFFDCSHTCNKFFKLIIIFINQLAIFAMKNRINFYLEILFCILTQNFITELFILIFNKKKINNK